MSLIAATDQPKNISTFARCCLSLANISGQLCLSFTENELYILAVNAVKTGNGEVSFRSSFFRDYTFNTHDILSDGHHQPSRNYSFVVSAKLMAMLFRGLDSNAVNYVHFGVECSESTPSSRRYKLNVEIFTKKQVLKKYQIGYLPVVFIPTDVPARYYQLHEKNRINQFSLEAPTYKLFIDMVPTASDDFKIEAKLKKLTFLASPPLTAKETDYLKQPMLISVQMSVDDLVLTTLGDTTVAVNFRLKDFRNYINLITAFKRDVRLSTEYTSENPTIDAYFSEPGEPILFTYRDTEVTVSLIQITANDNDPGKQERSSRLLIKAPVLQKSATFDSITESTASVRSSTSEILLRSRRSEEFNSHNGEFDEEPVRLITYGQLSPSRGTKRPLEQIDVPEENDGEADEDGMVEFGPTQVSRKPKSLFD